MSTERKDFPLVAKILNGGLAGMIGVACVFPLDLVKTRLQNQRIGPNGEKMYANIFDCFRKVYRAEGLRGMYRGSGVTILLTTPEKAVKLAANDFFRHHLTTQDGKLTVLRQMLAGGLAGSVQIVITTPLELIKIQLQDAGRTTKVGVEEAGIITARSVIKNQFQQKGIFGLYKGLGPTALRDITFSIFYFPLFSAINDAGPRRKDASGEAVAWWSLLSGLMAGSSAAVAVTPLDVIKTRIQVMRHAAGEEACIKIIDCAVMTYRTEGFKAFFKGGFCRMFVLAPLFGIAQMFYYFGFGEAVVRFFSS